MIRTDTARRSGTWRLYLIVFLASAASLSLELVAGRMLAPQLGVNIYTWTSIIGVVLAGISFGNFLGGQLADRFPAPSTIGVVLLAASGACFASLALLPWLSEELGYLPLIPQTLALNAGLFFLPSCLLGMITPLASKQALTTLGTAGGVVGRLYAVSTAGSILGVYLTGFVLVALLGSRHVVLLAGLILLALALLLGHAHRARWWAALALIPTVGLLAYALQPHLRLGSCTVESQYYCVQVEQVEFPAGPVKFIRLDHLVHGLTVVGDPDVLVYSYTQNLAEAAQYRAQDRPDFRALFLGGGGYSVPIHLERKYPQASIEVVEIDPAVTRIAQTELGLDPASRIVTYNEDARMAVRELPAGQYDLIVSDVFNDMAVPYHLTTREFNAHLQRLLNPEGIYLVNLIVKVSKGRFLRSFVHTLQTLYPHVYVLSEAGNYQAAALVGGRALPVADRTTVIVAAARQPIDFSRFRSYRTGTEAPTASVVASSDSGQPLAPGSRVLLTDDYAPVDTMVAELFTDDVKQWDWQLLVPPAWRRWLL